jgi:ELWxxDGT repeat protein
MGLRCCVGFWLVGVLAMVGAVVQQAWSPASVRAALFTVSNPAASKEVAQVAGTVFFVAQDREQGFELWKSDGTHAGTLLVRDINPGRRGSRPGYLTQVNRTLFFRAASAPGKAGLWMSDGSRAGTVLVKEFGGISPIHALAAVERTLYFFGRDDEHGFELWRSDGTGAGTVLVKDILPGHHGSGPSDDMDVLNVNGTLFFQADDGIHGVELWKSDGTEAGTVLVKDIPSRSKLVRRSSSWRVVRRSLATVTRRCGRAMGQRQERC